MTSDARLAHSRTLRNATAAYCLPCLSLFRSCPYCRYLRQGRCRNPSKGVVPAREPRNISNVGEESRKNVVLSRGRRRRHQETFFKRSDKCCNLLYSLIAKYLKYLPEPKLCWRSTTRRFGLGLSRVGQSEWKNDTDNSLGKPPNPSW
jgi:hypothetical protein